MIAYTLGAIAYVVMITMLVYRLVAVRDRKKWKKLTLFSLFIALGVLLFTYEGASPIVVVQLILGMLIFNGMIPTYGSDINFVYIAFGIVYILVSYVMGLTLIAQAMLLGMLSEVAMMRDLKERIGNRRTEVRRDAVQMAAGAAIILLFYFLNINLASVVLLFIIMAGIFLVNMAKERKSERISKLVYGLERRNTALGLGALWLALGVLIAISFLGKPKGGAGTEAGGPANPEASAAAPKSVAAQTAAKAQQPPGSLAVPEKRHAAARTAGTKRPRPSRQAKARKAK